MVNNYDVAVLSEKVAYLEAAIKNAGIELPEVTEADNGKTLQVIEGAWATGSKIPGVVNALDSTSETDALSAAQGKALDDKITGLLKTKSVTDTTNQYGVIALNIRGGYVLSAKVTGVNSNRTAIVFTYGTDWFVSIKDPTNLSNMENTEFTVDVSYI